MKAALILSFMASFNYAHAENSCLPENDLQKFSEEILSYVGPLRECPTEDDFILKEVTKEYQKNFGNLPQVTKTVKGFRLKGSDKELKFAGEILGAKPPKGWSDAAKDCSTIQCAFEKLLNSKEAAMQLLNIPAKSGYRLSLDQSINQDKADQMWSPKEIRELDAAVSKLPKELRNMRITYVERQADGYRGHGHEEDVAAYASPAIMDIRRAQLVIYDTGLKGTTSDRSPYETTSWPQETLIHELCHHHDFKGYYASNYSSYTSKQKTAGFSALSGWKETTGDDGKTSWVHNEDAQFVSWYAETSPAEDYAESCMNYVLHPDKLEKAAPSKYAYMKNKVFNKAEFKSKPWVKGPELNWPQLNELLSDESNCTETLLECIKDLEYFDGRIFTPNTENFSIGSAQSQIQKNACFNKFKNERQKKIEESLSQKDDFCDKGGPRVIKNNANKICKDATDSMVKILSRMVEADFKTPTEECEESNDFTYACVLNKVYEGEQLPEGFITKMNKIIQQRVPNRMAALGDKLAAQSTESWMRPCLSSVKSINHYNVTNSEGQTEKKFYYESKNKDYDPGFLTKYVFEHNDDKNVNRACAEKILEASKASGTKTPEAGNSFSLFRSTITDEVDSFEREVLLKIKSSKCILRQCKLNETSQALKEWEQKSPEKRQGMATEEFAKEILEILK